MNTCRLTAAGSLLAILLAGCGGGDAPDGAALRPQAAPQARTGPTAPTAPTAPESNAGHPEASTSTRGGPLAGIAQDFGYSVDTQSREQVRLFYKTIFASSEGIDAGWTGNVAGCVAGTTSSEYKAAVLRRANWFRAMAGVPATLQFDATFSAKAQQAALYMSANNTLTHTPTSGNCFNSTVAEAAGKSNLALGSSGVASVTNYIRDSGVNNNVAGHRRWLLYPQTQLMGTGDITGSPQANAIWVQDGKFGTTRPAVRDSFVAWPAKGYSPYATTYARWSLSYPGATFSGASVSMKENGAPISTCQETVQNGFGENTIVWRPKCMADNATWTKPAGDTTYEVTVSNITGIVGISSFTYNVVVFDPDMAGVGDDPVSINGPGSIPAAQPASFTFAAQPGATGYEWRSLQSSDYSLNDGAEGGTGNFTVPLNPGYDVVATDVHASGTASFHLTHLPGVDQSLLLNAELLAGAGTQLEFNSRLGVATTAQTALVEISTDNGQSWTARYSQVGKTASAFDPGESAFTPKSISLAAYANRTIRIRFRYARDVSGTYFPQSDSGVGWYLDDIKVTGASGVSASASSDTATPSFEFSRSSVTSVLLQARPGMFGYFGDWGVAKPVNVTPAVPMDPRDCLFNWAESQLPGVLAPHASSFAFAGYYLRYYPAFGIYVGIGDADNSVYYYASSGLVNLGNKGGWYAQAGCN